MSLLAVIVLNRGAGRRAEARRDHILAALSRTHRVELVEGRGARLRRALAEAMKQRPDLVVAAGGDGTVSSCATAVRGTESTLAIVAGGTANSIARALGIPTDLEEACELVSRGDVRAIDVADVRYGRALVKSRSMLLMASLGLHANAIMGASREAKRRYGAFAYLAATLDQLARPEPFDVELETEAERMRCRATAITVANVAPPYSVWAQGTAELRDDDGKLDVTVVEADSTVELISTGAHLLRTVATGEDATNEAVKSFRCTRIRIVTTPPQRLMVDGDASSTSPVEIAVVPRSLHIIAPRAEPPKSDEEDV
jgi:YegS/Rv2252/BmrU family lipid kinase